MKRITLIVALLVSIYFRFDCQITVNPKVTKTNVPQIEIEKIEIYSEDDLTFVYLSFKETRSNLIGPYYTISSNTYLLMDGYSEKLRILGLGDDLRLDQINRTKKGEIYNFVLVFPAIPPGLDIVDIIEENTSGSGFEWKGIKINNPDTSPKTDWTEIKLRIEWETNGCNSLEGIYENAIADRKSPKYRLALKYDTADDQYKLIYLSGATESIWKPGDIKAFISKTASQNIFTARWYLGNKSITEDIYITFEPGFMKLIWTADRMEQLYIKLYPTSQERSNSNTSQIRTGTGFAISPDGYVATSQHVINNAKDISVRGINGDFNKRIKAEIAVQDVKNDLAILKLKDVDSISIGNPPFTISNSPSEVGSSVFTLGYPLLQTMGEEVKVTNGIISSKTGFQGDITTYQLSVPVQPGNSGGPLFNADGSLIGVLSAKHLGAENSSYAVKSSYLISLINSLNQLPRQQDSNLLSNKDLSGQVLFLKNYVYIIEAK